MNQYFILKTVRAVLPGAGEPAVTDILVNRKTGLIEKIQPDLQFAEAEILNDYSGMLVMPGFIDPHVHFRVPGKSDCEDWQTGSLAALSAGVTTVLDMPNNNPATTNADALKIKIEHIEKHSLINYGIFGGLTENNLGFLLDDSRIKAIKVYLASTTGDMLIRDIGNINFSAGNKVFSFHAEDENIIAENSRSIKLTEPVLHSKIRSEDAAVKSTSAVIELHKKTGGKFHIAHVSTAREMELLVTSNLTYENAPHHIFCNTDNYANGGFLWKCNPPLRSPETASRLKQFLYDEKIQMIATDHAPHLISDKLNEGKTPASGIPSLEVGTHLILSEMSLKKITPSYAAQILSSNAADRFSIENRGYLKPGFFADIAIINDRVTWTFAKDDILSKCGWSTFMDYTFHSRVEASIVNGLLYRVEYLKNSSRRNQYIEQDKKIYRI